VKDALSLNQDLIGDWWGEAKGRPSPTLGRVEKEMLPHYSNKTYPALDLSSSRLKFNSNFVA
jgi:hypothetical protein